MRKGFTMIELLVVIGILGILMAALVSGFAKAPQKAEVARCQELVKNTETALAALFTEDGLWPRALIANNNSRQGLDAKAAYPLAKGGVMALSYDEESQKLSGTDKFGIVTPWAMAVIKSHGTSASDSTRVPIGGKIADHRLFYALDLDGDGKIEGVNVAGTVEGLKKVPPSLNIRATAAVWCRGPKGEFICSWADGQTREVK